MGSPHAAIIHLREPGRVSVRCLIEPLLRATRGVAAVCYEPADSLITVHFDAEQAGLADLVRLIEDNGQPVSGVAQRRLRRLRFRRAS